MADGDEFWDFYWEVALQEMEDLGKREAILAVSRLMRGGLRGNVPESIESGTRPTSGREAELLGVAKPVRLLELGCGEGQVIGALLKAHADDCAVDGSCGVDYSHPAIEKCRRLHPGVRFLEGDFTDRGRS